MTLYLIGTGLNDEKDITLKGLEAVKKCDFVYLENYTSKLGCSISDLEDLYGKKIILADRNLVEKEIEKEILEKAKTNNVALLIIGDPVSATTHIDLIERARELGIDTKIIHNTSIMTAIGITGLQLYKFGKTSSIPFPQKSYEPETPYDILKENGTIGAHTLLLLDLKPEEDKFMSVNDAVRYLIKIEAKRKEGIFTEETLCLGCARIGGDSTIRFGKAKELVELDFGKAPHCLIVPGKMHFMEEEFLKKFQQ